MKHKRSYYVWVYGDRYWHRTLNGAMKRAEEARRYCSQVQITEVETGKLVYGSPQ